MKLTEQDVAYLRQHFHEDKKSILQILNSKIQIEQATDEYAKRTSRITHEKARQLLGDAQYLAAIDRCVFHKTATREIEGSKQVLYFEDLSWRNL